MSTSGTWNCAVCTFVNNGAHAFCAVCGTTKPVSVNVPPSWQCSKCTFMNESVSNCQMCNSSWSQQEAEREKKKENEKNQKLVTGYIRQVSKRLNIDFIDETLGGGKKKKSYQKRCNLLCYGYLRMQQDSVKMTRKVPKGIKKMVYEYVEDPPTEIAITRYIFAFFTGDWQLGGC